MPPWVRTSPLLRARGVRHGFCVIGRPDDGATAGVVAPGAALQLARQVHGCAVALAGWPADAVPAADAVASSDPAHACAVRTADCAPVLVACLRTGAATAVHAGWRGLAEGVIPKAVSAMSARFGAVPAECVAAIGPCARACHYEIGEEVAEAMDCAGCAAAVARRPGMPRPFLDVAAAARIQLAEAGIPADAIDGEPPCSIESAWCPSHRRAPADGARMLSLIVPPRAYPHGTR